MLRMNFALADQSWSKPGEASNMVTKPVLTPRKVMLSVWWDRKIIVYYELLKPGQIIDLTLYCQQLMRLKQVNKKKQPELINRKDVFHQVNARPHISFVTRQKLRELGWEILLYPPYSPELALPDYPLFRSLQNSLNGTSDQFFVQ